jgi:Family of unknown function (DUF5670)
MQPEPSGTRVLPRRSSQIASAQVLNRCTLQNGTDESAAHEELAMLWRVPVVLLILWLLGFSLHIGGGPIHLLLVVGLVVLVINLLGGRRTAS